MRARRRKKTTASDTAALADGLCPVTQKAILLRIRAHVRAGRVFVSAHAKNELREDELDPFDLEHVLATGFLAERQRDGNTGAWK